MRALKVLVVGMGVLIVAGTVTLVALIVQRAGGVRPELPAVVGALGQPEGARIGGIAPAAEGRVAVWVQRPDGDRILLVDGRSGRPVGEVRLGE
ncbi:DUF6476 family protein [Muricoccus radiodurans]|uniref:DUF6476 family protein n=1 Tax=Muricoccus radiodurans TaxID=2231721 RepID=UPI003CEEF8EF